MAKVTSQDKNWLLKEKYAGKMTGGFQNDLKRLEKGEPLDYVIGYVNFLGCKIDLSQRTLIPRPETEFWVERAIKQIKSEGKDNPRILDLFSGSGCIGIAILKNIPKAQVDFVDNARNAIQQIKQNLKLNGIDISRGKVIESDVFAQIKGQYDYIFANPPYIPMKYKSEVQKSVLNFEPHEALFGGNDGLLYIRKFMIDADKFLKPTGVFYMEFDSRTYDQLKEMIEEDHRFTYRFWHDQYRQYRVLQAIYKRQQAEAIQLVETPPPAPQEE